MSYVNPLHPPVSSSKRSDYSSLGGAVTTGSPSQFLSPSRRRLPQAPYIPASKWRNAGRPNQLHNPVTFDYIGYNKQGVPMRELSTRGAAALGSMIQGANDAVLAHTGLAQIMIRILWPGYEHIEWSRSIEIYVNGPITRAQLGAAAAMNFARFIEKTRSEPPRSEWHLGPSGIRFEHLVLLSLYNTFEDSWQADVAVDLR